MNKILITGANGNLGGTLVKELADHSSFGVVAVASEKKKVFDMLEREQVENRESVYAVSSDDFLRGEWTDDGIFAAVHMAFSRANRSSRDIAASLDYSRRVYHRLHEMKAPRVIYISSQSVYGTTSEWRTEATPVSPEIVYSMAKYAGEKLLETEFSETGALFSVLRLDYVIQSQRLVSALCQQARTTGVLSLKGGKQVFSYIDKTDAAKAIVALLQYDGEWRHVYNVGPDRMRLSLVEIAEVVKQVAEKHGYKGVDIQLEATDTELWSGMDSSLFTRDTGWQPSMDIYRMVEGFF